MTNSNNEEYDVEYSSEALDDIENYPSTKDRIFAVIDSHKKNPLPKNEGGYGKPLGNKKGLNLVGCLKIVLKHPPIRIVYKLDREKKLMIILAVDERDDLWAYAQALKRLNLK